MALKKDNCIQGKSSGCLELVHRLMFLVYIELKESPVWEKKKEKKPQKTVFLKEVFSFRE